MPETNKYLCSKVISWTISIYLGFFSVNCVPDWFQAIFAACFSKIFTINLVVADDCKVFSQKIFLLILFIFILWNVFAHKKMKETVFIRWRFLSMKYPWKQFLLVEIGKNYSSFCIGEKEHSKFLQLENYCLTFENREISSQVEEFVVI